jgi:hypothetical protein
LGGEPHTSTHRSEGSKVPLALAGLIRSFAKEERKRQRERKKKQKISNKKDLVCS